MNSALALKADSATLGVYAKTETLANYATNNSVDNKLKSYATTTEMNSALNLKANSADLGVYAKTTEVDGKISEVEGKLALGIETDDNGNKYAYLNGSADTIKFDASKTIEINSTNFGLDADGTIRATKGRIGNCAVEEITYPKVGTDLGNIVGYGLKYQLEGSEYTVWLEYPVRYSPSDEYSQRKLTPVSYTVNGKLNTDVAYTWNWAWHDSYDTEPTYREWELGATFSTMDSSVIKTKPYLWLKCFGNRQGETSDACIATFYVGDFTGYLTTFTFGDGALRLGDNIITGKKSAIKFEDTHNRLIGTWYYGAEPMTTSWRGAKYDIEELDDRYSTLFDGLQPTRFKYNDGESDRYHTGFILDELKVAMDEANVDTSELAAYCVSDETTGAGGIRYGELIALCVNEIQKLKKRVTELEDKLNTTQND